MREADVIRVIKDYLQIQYNQGKLMYIRNNSGAMPVIDGKNNRRYIRFGDKGSPDFLVWMSGMERIPISVINPERDFTAIKMIRSIAIEAKSDIGKQSKDQIKWQADFERIGGVYYIVRSLDELIKAIS